MNYKSDVTHQNTLGAQTGIGYQLVNMQLVSFILNSADSRMIYIVEIH